MPSIINRSTARAVAAPTAAPERLLLLTLDALIAQMQRARDGLTAARPEVTRHALARSRQALGELLAAVDVQHGGEVAHRLTSLYVFVLSEIDVVRRDGGPARLERNLTVLRALRDAFARTSRGSPQPLQS